MLLKPQAIVVIGVAGSGKSTVAREVAVRLAWDYVDADDFHTADARTQMASGLPLTDAQREPWVQRIEAELQRRARQRCGMVVAFSGLRAAHRQRLRSSGIPIRFVFLDAAPAVIAARLAARTNHFMPGALLASQLEALEIPTAEPDVVTVNVEGPLLQVVDEVLRVVRSPW